MSDRNDADAVKKSLNDIYRKIDITAETRFHAARRLMLHADISLKINIIVSLFFIFITLLQALDVGKGVDSGLVPIFQAIGAMSILISSIISSLKDYTGSAEKFYSCASELVDLKREIFYGVESGDADYSDIVDKYGKILKKYETHTVKDFRSDHTKALAESKHDKDQGRRKKFKNHVKWLLGYFMDFSWYLFAAIVLLPLLLLILFGGEPFLFFLPANG